MNFVSHSVRITEEDSFPCCSLDELGHSDQAPTWKYFLKIILNISTWCRSSLTSSNKPSKFRLSISSRTLPPMSPHSGGGKGKHLTLKLTDTIILSPHCRLSNENVSSVYDDRLDKVDPEGTLQPRQRRWASGHVIITMCHTVTISSHGPGGVAAICIQTRSATHLWYMDPAETAILYCTLHSRAVHQSWCWWGVQCWILWIYCIIIHTSQNIQLGNKSLSNAVNE